MGLAGLCIGSFLATVARRWPQGAGAALAGRSACDGCGRPLGALDLVPVLGRVLQHGRCRHCGVRIPLTETWIELAAMLVGVVAATAPLPTLPWLAGMGWLLVLLAAIDQLDGLLPDPLNLLLAIFGGAALLLDPLAPTLVDGLLGGLLGAGSFALIAVLYARLRGRAGLGGGDVKLMGGLGLWTGAASLSWIVLLAATGALAAALVQSRGRFEPGQALRFGPWLAGAGFLVTAIGRGALPWLG